MAPVAAALTYRPEPEVGGLVTGHVGASCIRFRFERTDGAAITNLTHAVLQRWSPSP